MRLPVWPSMPRNRPGPGKARLLVDTARATVTVDGRPVRATPKEFQALSYLHSRNGEVCTKDELARRVWPEHGGEVDDYSLEQLVSRLRRKIEPDHRHPQFLLTVRGLGYRLETTAETIDLAPSRPLVPVRGPWLAGALLALVIPAGAAAIVLLQGGDRETARADGEAPQGSWLLTDEDDFSDAQTSLFPRGPGATTAVGLIFSRGIEGGEYVVRLLQGPERSGVSSLAAAVSLEAFAFEVEARSNRSVQFGLTLFWNSADFLNLRMNAVTMSYELVHGLEGTLVSRGSSPLVKPEAINHLRFELQGRQLTVVINDAVAETITLESIGRRPVTPGLFVFVPAGHTLTDGTKVVFDNFRLFAARSD